MFENFKTDFRAISQHLLLSKGSTLLLKAAIYYANCNETREENIQLKTFIRQLEDEC